MGKKKKKPTKDKYAAWLFWYNIDLKSVIWTSVKFKNLKFQYLRLFSYLEVLYKSFIKLYGLVLIWKI